jgi:small GTP-binding protein
VLEKVEVGKKVKVLDIEGKEDSLKKLQAMGIRKGKVLEVVQKLGRSIVVKVGHSKIAISKSLGPKDKGSMKISVALVGNPNVGKTSLLNHIAGTTLRVGNWAGTTVEKKEGKAFYKGYEIYLVDLPGIYSLEPFSEAEQVARDYLLNQKPDVVVNVLETPNMERDLLLTAELLEMEIPTVIALNMLDEARRLGIEVDKEKLS